MAKKLTVVIFLFVTFVVLVMSREISLSEANKKLYSELESGQGLYGNDTKVIVLNVQNFKKSVYNTKNAWLVEFYNSWCGFCQRFAPIWKSLAADIYGWQDAVKIAAIDCAADDNNPLCREYEIMHYPALKFFSAGSNVGHMGTEIEKGGNSEHIRRSVVEVLKKEQIEGRGSSWPNITPYRSNDIQNLWKNVPDTVIFTFLIFEDAGSYIGTEVILDLHAIKEIQIRSVLNQNEALFKLMGMFTYPGIVVLERDQTSGHHLKALEESREGFRGTVTSFLKSRNIELTVEKSISTDKQPEKAVTEKKAIQIKRSDDTVYQVDLDNTIQYSLKREIPLRKSIHGDSLVALKKYLKVLAKYFPIGYRGTLFLEKLRDKVLEVTELKGQQFSQYILDLETEIKPSFHGKEDWVGCKGSSTRYRRYPCGLWTTFHTLTINAVLQNENRESFNSLEVLDAMLGYVTHFFGCHDCSKHFQEMAGKSMRANVTSPDESILWLWSAHNQVNKRLSGDVTEDKVHPKIQFPSKESCPACRSSDGKWVNRQVLVYLKQMYNKNYINNVGWDNEPNGQLMGKNEALVLVESIETTQSKRSGWNFNIFDISLCVVLYAFSAIILMLVFIKFIMRKRYRKKMYIHDILGKV